jgi:hypothetical protein
LALTVPFSGAVVVEVASPWAVAGDVVVVPGVEVVVVTTVCGAAGVGCVAAAVCSVVLAAARLRLREPAANA